MRRCREDGINFLSCIRDIIAKILHTPRAHLVLVSVIPSPASNDRDWHLFKRVDAEMNKYAQESGGKVSFLNLKDKFITSNTINMEYYDQREREQGIVHLSPKGASMVAETLKNYLVQLNNNKWD